MYDRRRRPRSRRGRVSPSLSDDTIQHKHPEKKNAILVALLVVLIVGICVGGWQVYVLYGGDTSVERGQGTSETSTRQESVTTLKTSEETFDRTASDRSTPEPDPEDTVLAMLSRHLIVESFIEDTDDVIIGYVSDPTEMREYHVFFIDAEAGDLVVKLKEIMILYRPSIDRIINISTNLNVISDPSEYVDPESESATTSVNLSEE